MSETGGWQPAELAESAGRVRTASESSIQRPGEASAEPRGTVAGGAGGVGKNSEAVR
jgi:hypothetical protein